MTPFPNSHISVLSMNPEKIQSTNQQNTNQQIDSSNSSLKNPQNWSDRIHSIVVHCYRRWAHFVVAHPYKIIIFCFLLTGICTFKMAKTKKENNIRGYTPYG